MTNQRLLQIHVAILVTIGSLLLSLGDGNLLYPALTLFAAIASIIFYRYIALGPFESNGGKLGGRVRASVCTRLFPATQRRTASGDRQHADLLTGHSLLSDQKPSRLRTSGRTQPAASGCFRGVQQRSGVSRLAAAVFDGRIFDTRHALYVTRVRTV